MSAGAEAGPGLLHQGGTLGAAARDRAGAQDSKLMAEHRTLTASATVGPVRQGAGLVREGAAGSFKGRRKDQAAASSSPAPRILSFPPINHLHKISGFPAGWLN